MLCSIHHGRVKVYTEGQGPIVHLVSTVQSVQEAGLPFAFSDGHSRVAFSEFYDDVKELDRVDWQIMKERYWSDTISDNDRSRRRQAEFLVHNFFPWELIHSIGVINQRIKARVEEALNDAAHKPLVNVHGDWYY